VVLVHGAWADASSWNGVVKRLQRAGYPVIAPANPLRGLSSDAAYIGSVLTTVEGPVVLVGHSYGGAVITNAANGHPNVRALVYVAAFVPDEGEDILSLGRRYPGSLIVPPGFPGATLTARPFPLPGGGGDVDLYISPDSFRELFAEDLLEGETDVMAATQRPISLNGGGEKSGPPAWKKVPSWALVATADRAIGTDNVRFMAQRAGSKIVEVRASHAVPVSKPGEVVELIEAAARGTR
jgi:pimeloyl-ACP methyl ester carboxylesterase